MIVLFDAAWAAAVSLSGAADPGPGMLDGFYYEPTVLDQVSPGMPVVSEEVFGPAVPVVRAASAELAISLANK